MNTCAGKYLEGSNAIGMPAYRSSDCRILRPDFGSKNDRAHSDAPVDRRRYSSRLSQASHETAWSRACRKIFEGSEMLCSLAFEDIRGCAYNIFTKREVLGTSAVITTIMLVSAFIGA